MNQKQNKFWIILNPIVNYFIIYWLFSLSSCSYYENISLFIIVVIGTHIWKNIENYSEFSKKSIRTITWITFIVVVGLMFYVNHYMPHGEIIYTGEVYNESGKEYIYEDMRQLDIPDWAKLLRAKTGFILFIGIFVLIIINDKTKKESDGSY